MSRGGWDWIGEVWRAIASDRPVLVLLIAALILCAAILTLVLR